jgi:hypothetical protein
MTPAGGSRTVRWSARQTAFLNVGDTLNLTVLPAFTFTGSPVRGLRALRFCLDDAERAKAGKGEAAGGFQLLDDRRDDISGGAVCGHCRRPGGFLQNCGQKGFGQERESLLDVLLLLPSKDADFKYFCDNSRYDLAQSVPADRRTLDIRSSAMGPIGRGRGDD